MTLEDAASIIFDETRLRGNPLPMPLCEHIARRILYPHVTATKYYPPIAQTHRDRYEE